MKNTRAQPISPFSKYVCEEHGIVDGFPCPWPDCINGIEEENLEVNFYPGGNRNKIYFRHQWRSPIRGTYFTWEHEDLPHWFSCGKTLWNEARRLELVKDQNISTVYHYTSVDAFVKIVESHSIWFSDYSYLNDESELIHGVGIVSEVIENLLRTGPSNDAQNLLEAWLDSISKDLPRICIASFSGDSDSLTHWRNYGSIALGFNPQLISIHAYLARMGAVEYDLNTQRQLVEVFLHHLLQAYLRDIENNALDRISDVYHRTEQLLELVAFFKDMPFQNEQEFRLAYLEHPQFIDRGLESPPIRFRQKGNRLIPYISSSDLCSLTIDERRETNRETGELGICEIVLGPEEDDLVARGIREFLDSNGMDEIPINRSNIPYRS